MLASLTVIRDAVIHLFNEQPLRADLPDVPSPGDISLVCTNLRMMNGKRPVFVDDSESTFVFPFTQIRFLEIPRREEARPAEPQPLALPAASPDTDELELDEELLRRVREL
jgi:hypothetical protein